MEIPTSHVQYVLSSDGASVVQSIEVKMTNVPHILFHVCGIFLVKIATSI